MRNSAVRNGSVFALGLFLLSVAQAATIYVDKTATGNGNGTSWSNAFTELAAALPTANSGDQVWVVQGTYNPDINNTLNRNLTFTLKSGVAVYGGFRGGETAIGDRNVNLYVTILSGDIGVVGDDSDNSYHVVTGADGSTENRLDGFTVTGGRADGFGTRGMGGGMLNWNAKPTISNCVFTNNFAKDFGGGMVNDNDSNVVVTNCTFTNNNVEDVVLGAGGGMSNKSSSPIISNCSFSGNTASDSGGGMYNTAGDPNITNCSFTANSAVYGGGMHNTQCAAFSISSSSFTGNTADYGGGMSNISAIPNITDSNFVANKANIYGGGMFNSEFAGCTLTNCTFSSNTTDDSGGGMYARNSSPKLTNCKFNQNAAAGDDGHANDASVDSASGGGGYYGYDSEPTFYQCSFTENFAKTFGGGVHNFRSNIPTGTPQHIDVLPKFDRCAFVGNSALRGGGMYGRGTWVVISNWRYRRGVAPQVYNSLFYANSATDAGGGVYCSQSDVTTLTNCTFTWNSASWGGALSSRPSGYFFTAPSLKNCILWGDRATLGGSEIYDGKTLPEFYYTMFNSCVQGGMTTGGWTGTCISLSPQFVNELVPEGSDGIFGTGDDGLRLLSTSPCVDVGDNTFIVGYADDLPKNVRIKNAIVDMGAYEGGISNPIAVNDSYSMLENGVLSVAAPGVLGNDNDDGLPPPSAILVTNPTNGVLTFNANGSFTYTPYTGYFGTDSFTYQATNGLLSNVATVTITVIEVEDDVQIVSGPTVSSTTANPGDTLSFSVAAVSPLGYPVTYLWDFGDGTYSSEANPTHIYLVGGTYIVNVIISDGNSTKTVTFVVTISGGGGSGSDSGGSVVAQFGELKILKMQAKLNFRQPGRDQCRVQGMVELPVGMAVGQRNVVLNVAGAQVSFTLNAKGTGKNDNGVFLLKRKRMSGFYGQGGWTNFQANLKNGNWSSIWSTLGMSNETTGGKNVVVDIYLGVDGHVYGVKQNGYYTARSGGGTLKTLQ